MPTPRSTGTDQSHSPAAQGPLDEALDAALRRALPAPALPPGWAQRLQQRLEALGRPAPTADPAYQRLLQQHERERQALREGELRIGLHTLALVVAVSFASGALAVAALPWLTQHLGAGAPWLMPSLALGSGALAGVGSWAWRQRPGA